MKNGKKWQSNFDSKTLHFQEMRENHLFLKAIFLGFVRNDKKKKKMAVKMLDFRIRKKHVSLNKFKKKFLTQHPVCLQKFPIFT